MSRYPSRSDARPSTNSETYTTAQEGISSDECTLCSFVTPADPITATDVGGHFCCRGCLEVHRTLERVEDTAEDDVRDRLTDETRVLDDLEGEDIFLSVDGMRCTTCEAFLEMRASDIDGVLGVEASYATDTLRLVYDADAVGTADFSEIISGYGYEVYSRTQERDSDPRNDTLVKFLVGGGLFGMMVMVWYALFLYPTYFGYEPLAEFGSYDGFYIVTNIWLMASFVLFYTGFPILRGAYVSLQAGRPNMDLLVTLAAVGSYVYSTLAMVFGRPDLYFDVTVAIILVVTAGTYYEGVIKRRAAGLLSELTRSQVDEARRAENGETVPLSAVNPGEHLLVRSGERVPLDGAVVDGQAAVDESLTTGESLPIEKQPGDPVRGGTIVTDAPLIVEVGDEAESTHDRIVSLLWSIQSARPGVQRLADKLATIFVPVVIVLAVIMTSGLLAIGSSLATAFLVGLTIIIVTCPCALGLATPLAIASGVQTAARRGIVVAAETIFEDAQDIDVVVLDKTGTLTEGKMSVEDVYVAADEGEFSVDTETVLRLAGTVEALSDHPIGRAIADTATDNYNLESSTDTDGFKRYTRGVSNVVDGMRVFVGHPELLREHGLVLPSSVESQIEDARSTGDVPVVVGWEGYAHGVIVVGDSPREDWDDTIETLAASRELVVLTGDDGSATDRFRAVDAVDEVFAGVPPEAKAATIRRLRARGTVAMIGDGSNDAPALAAADVGIAMGGRTQLATDAADVVIVNDELSGVAKTFDIASKTHRRIRQNLGWAFMYNIIVIPLALVGLLNPLIAAVAMATSSMLVVLNSSRQM